ncbi:uncharacterized protein LOC122947890 [Acropora millepora]|uniref:uncharacterized protein LOC122947890 n=1 Tax=Acropora millepora TaxID=45264 RepID=UPI001CF1315B|nr:uncharacterized protein LOC122947890 [Acropora millepora]
MSQGNGQDNSLLPLQDTAMDEFAYDSVLTKLTELQSDDEEQRGSFLESVRRLEKYHVIQIYKLGVRPLLISLSDTSEFRLEAKKLFDLCSSFCYTQDMFERITFDYFSKALQFCFPPQAAKRLPSTVVSKLLELVQIFQKENIVSHFIEQNGQQPNTPLIYTRRGSKYLIDELLEIFQARRDRVEGCIIDVIDQTKTIAILDTRVHKMMNIESNPVFLTSWVKLLKITEVSNYFASCLAKDGPVYFHPLSQVSCSWPTAQQFQTVLEEIKSAGGEIHLPTDRERIGLFLKHITHFCQYHDCNIILSSLKLLTSSKIDTEVLEVVFEKFLFKGKRQVSQYLYPMINQTSFEKKALDLLSDVLRLFPKGTVFKIIQLCEKFFSSDPDYHTLCKVLTLFIDGLDDENHCSLERRTENVLELFRGLESSWLPFISLWYPFFVWFIKEIQSSFDEQKRTELETFIRNTLTCARTSKISFEHKMFFVTSMEQFFDWLSGQDFATEIKSEISALLVCCRFLIRDAKFLTEVIKQLGPCTKLTLEFKKFVLCELDDLAKHFKGDKERDVFQKILGILSSSRVYECTQELLFEIFTYLKRFFDKDRPMKTIPHPVLRLLSLISTVPISDDRRLKVIQRAKASGSGLSSSTLMLELMTSFFRLEEANEFFDHVHSVFVDEFKEDEALVESFQKTIRKALSLTSFRIVPKVGILEVARSICTGTFNEEVDSCCLMALGMSDSEMEELFSEVKRCANEIFKGHNGSDSKPYGQDNLFWPFTDSLHNVVSSVGFSGKEKLILVEKVCDIFRKGLDVKSRWHIIDALENLIPCAQGKMRGLNREREKNVIEL